MKPPQPLLQHQCEMWFALLCIPFPEYEKQMMPKRVKTDLQIIKWYVYSQETTVDYDRSRQYLKKKKKFSKFQKLLAGCPKEERQQHRDNQPAHHDSHYTLITPYEHLTLLVYSG